MTARVGQTRKGASRLLKTVGGRPHATDQDHDGAQQTDDAAAEGLSYGEHKDTGLLGDEDVNAEPVDPDEEALRTPPKPSKSTADADALRKPSGSSRKRKAEAPAPDPEPGLRKPLRTGTRTSTPPTAFRVPPKGRYEQSRTAKGALEGDKENTTASPTPPASSGDPWGFGMLSSQPEQKGPKVTFGSTSKAKNIHVAAPPPKKTKAKPIKYGSRSKSNGKNVQPESDGSESDISMMGDDELDRLGVMVAQDQELDKEELGDADLRRVKPRKRPARTNGDAAGPSTTTKSELEDLLKPARRHQLGLVDTPESSLPPSSMPQEEMDNIDSYMRELPAVAEEGTECAICHETVDQESYWEFWKGRNKTVKNQALYCHTHRKATAQKEFEAEGLQPIEWGALDRRIKTHRMALHKILVGDPETPSTYRTRYEPLALTGKAAAVPSKRTDLSPSKQAKLASYALDDNAVYPGYYGPRGRRVITESVMALLSKEIKRCSDAVVQTSGPATFVQAVLVPEVALRLIMEDCHCDWDAAEELRERTFDMGLLLNEEIEDHVELGDGADESEAENDYHH